MCLAVPVKVLSAKGNLARVECGKIRRTVRTDLVDASAGDYVLVHAGFAISVLDPEQAKETLELFEKMI